MKQPNNPDKFKKHLEETLQHSEFAWWDWHIPSNQINFNDLKVKWLGYAPEDFKNSGYQAFTSLLHPDDHDKAMDAMRKYLSGEEPLYKVDYRIKTAAGDYKWYIDRGITVSTDKKNNPIRLRGIVLDLGAHFSQDKISGLMVQLLRHVIPLNKNADNNIITLCSNCKRLKISDDNFIDYRGDLNTFLDLRVSHSICPDCLRALYPEYAGSASFTME